MPRSRKTASKGIYKTPLTEKTPAEKQKERRNRVKTIVDSTKWDNYAILGAVDDMITDLFDKEVRLLEMELELEQAKEKVEQLTELLGSR